MNEAKRRRLEKAGWKTGTVQEFLGLTDADAAFIEVKLALTEEFKATRRRLHLSQQAVAKQLGSSQSRVAKMEAGDSSISLDLLIRGLLALGQTPRTVARVIARAA
jgi:DNA-binding XRE family transcriptional regulator